MSYEEQYKLLLPKYKYTRVFCSEQDIEIAERVRDYIDREVMPRRHDLEGGWHRDEKLAVDTRWKVFADLFKMGVTKINLPKRFGGLELGRMCGQIVSEEMSRADVGLSTQLGKLNWITGIMRTAKRDDLLEEFAPQLGGDDAWAACVAITEPSGGASIEDPALEFRTIRTIAKQEGDEWVINGHKLWPGPAGPAGDFKTEHLKGIMGYWVVATTDPSLGKGGVGVFIVPPDAEGLDFSKPYQKMGQCYTDDNCDIWFDNVRIPERYRVDTQPGEGANIVQGAIVAHGRLGSAFKLLGLCDAVLEIVLEHTGRRQIAGKPVRERSYFAAIIAEMFKRVEVCRQYSLSVAWQATQPDIYGPLWSPEMKAKASLARSFSGDMAEFCTNKGMELMGAYGYAYDYHVEKYMRDFKMVKLWLGGPQRDMLDIAQGLYGPFKWAGYEEWLRSGAEITI
jgi:alkylation response protein AidB-like acyl-CoA dehydrogenase